jgi:hypothetical protein
MNSIVTTAITSLAIAAAACGTSNRASNANTSERASNPAASNAPAADQRGSDSAAATTITGCLQRDGRTYIVTRINEPSQPGVGTAGSGAAVEREQIREASNAYRIDAKNQSDLDSMVGKQVRVNGRVERSANLPEPTGTDKRDDLDKGDLAKIEADSVSVVADNCGSGAARTTGSGGKTRTTGKQR